VLQSRIADAEATFRALVGVGTLLTMRGRFPDVSLDKFKFAVQKVPKNETRIQEVVAEIEALLRTTK
jgi:hypothetical protein